MAIDTDWQARLVERDFMIGRDTDYPGIGGIQGLGILEPRRTDQPRGHRDGDARGRDRYPARNLAIPVTVLGDTDDTIWANYRALAVAWRRSDVDLQLELRIPGAAEEVLSYFGRPGSLDGQPRGLKSVIRTAAEFRCDTYAYGAEVSTATDNSSPLTIAAATAGDPGANTDRAVLTIVGNGGTPVVTNTTTGGVLAFAVPVTGTYVVDLHTQRTVKATVTKDHEVAASATWFDLAGGVDNVIDFAGCASIQLDYRPAYEVL